MTTRTQRRPTRPMEWFTNERAFAAIASAGQDNHTLFNASSVGARFVKGTTITRMIIDVRLKPDTVAQQVNLSWGVVVMNADARAAGAFPDVDDISERPGWLVRGRLTAISANLSDMSQQDRVLLDNRSQRILRNEEDELQFIVDAGSDGFGMLWFMYIRTLVKWA